MDTPFIPENGTPQTLEGAFKNACDEWLSSGFKDMSLNRLSLIAAKHIRDKISQDLCLILMKEQELGVDSAVDFLCKKWGIRIQK